MSAEVFIFLPTPGNHDFRFTLPGDPRLTTGSIIMVLGDRRQLEYYIKDVEFNEDEDVTTYYVTADPMEIEVDSLDSMFDSAEFPDLSDDDDEDRSLFI